MRRMPIANTPIADGTSTEDGVRNPALVARIKARQMRNEPSISTVSLAAESGNIDQNPARPAYTINRSHAMGASTTRPWPAYIFRRHITTIG